MGYFLQVILDFILGKPAGIKFFVLIFVSLPTVLNFLHYVSVMKKFILTCEATDICVWIFKGPVHWRFKAAVAAKSWVLTTVVFVWYSESEPELRLSPIQ